MTEYWTVLVIGITMIISPWVLGFSDVSLAKWCNIVLGLVLAVMSAWKIFGTAPADVVQPLTEELQKKKSKGIKHNVE